MLRLTDPFCVLLEALSILPPARPGGRLVGSPASCHRSVVCYMLPPPAGSSLPCLGAPEERPYRTRLATCAHTPRHLRGDEKAEHGGGSDAALQRDAGGLTCVPPSDVVQRVYTQIATQSRHLRVPYFVPLQTVTLILPYATQNLNTLAFVR